MARDRVKSAKPEALDQALRELFLSLQARALPDSLRVDRPGSLLDQLSDGPRKRPEPAEPNGRT